MLCEVTAEAFKKQVTPAPAAANIALNNAIEIIRERVFVTVTFR
jgi:hypothetical protein